MSELGGDEYETREGIWWDGSTAEERNFRRAQKGPISRRAVGFGATAENHVPFRIFAEPISKRATGFGAMAQLPKIGIFAALESVPFREAPLASVYALTFLSTFRSPPIRVPLAPPRRHPSSALPPPTPHLSTLSLHDALPIFRILDLARHVGDKDPSVKCPKDGHHSQTQWAYQRLGRFIREKGRKVLS